MTEPLRVCTGPGCRKLVRGGGRCDKHRKERTASSIRYDKQRGTTTERGYGGKWQKMAKQHLLANPLCVECMRHGITKAGQDVDHIVPHGGDTALLYDADNLQTLCKACHGRKTRRENRTGVH